jgi:hypothetical protein
MKKIIIVAIIAFIGLSLKSNAQCINEKLSYPIYKLGAALVDQFDTDGKEIVRIEYDLVFTSKESFRNLSADWEYSIIGFADGGVKDLDVKVYEYDDLLDKWTLVAEDASSESYAMATVKPTKDALYKVDVIVYSFNEGYDVARYGLMYVHD